MGLIETLSKEYPVPYKRTRDMSESEYMKLVDRNTDLLDENKTLKEEIERLDNIIKQQDTRNSRQRIANRKLLERNQDLVIENLKLNNIINELERYINEEYIYDELGMKIFDASKLQDKLQELKGEDKE